MTYCVRLLRHWNVCYAQMEAHNEDTLHYATLDSSPMYHPTTRIVYLFEALLGCLPVDNVPDSLEVLGLAVLVIETVTSQPMDLIRPKR